MTNKLRIATALVVTVLFLAALSAVGVIAHRSGPHAAVATTGQTSGITHTAHQPAIVSPSHGDDLRD